ncbi:MAG: hypothetical protein AAFW97_15725 [Pseudomonadota bacterium]
MKQSLLLIAAVLFVSPAAAQPTDIEVESGSSFLHERTGAELPAAIGALQRVQIADFGQQQFDIIARYQNEERNTEISIYIYRAGLPDVSLWFDRVLMTITRRDGFEPTTPDDVVVTAFTPPGHSGDTGLRMSYAPRPDERFAGTAAALARYGDWLVKVRASSTYFDPDLMGRLVDIVFEQIELPDGIGAPGLAYLVEPCTTELLTAEAQQLSLDTFDALPLSMLFGGVGQTVTADGEEIEPEPVRYCRDVLSTDNYGVYRANEAPDGYVVAFSDAGAAISVGRGNTLLDLLRDVDGSVAVTLQTSDGNLVYLPFDALPVPTVAVAVIDGQSPIAASDRSGNLQIFVNESE